MLKNRDITLPTKFRLVKAMVFPVITYGWESWTIKKSWVLKNWCFWTVVKKDSWESLGLQGDPTSPSYRRSVLSVHWNDWCWSWNSNTLATPFLNTLEHLKSSIAWEMPPPSQAVFSHWPIWRVKCLPDFGSMRCSLLWILLFFDFIKRHFILVTKGELN